MSATKNIAANAQPVSAGSKYREALRAVLPELPDTSPLTLFTAGVHYAKGDVALLADQQAQAAINSGACGVQALSAAPAAGGWVPPMPVVFKFEKNKPKPDAYAAYTVGQLHEAYRAGIAASLTPPAEQPGTPPAGWLPVHSNGRGFYGGPLKTEDEAKRYISQVEQSNDSVTLVARAFVWADEQQAAPRAAPGEPGWWRKRADEIEAQVALTGSPEAMRCYTDMRTLLQAATETAPLPLLVRDIAADFGVAPIQVISAAEVLGFGNFSVNMAVTPELVKALRKHFESAPQPAPAPLSDDTERLEWLLWKLPGDALRYVVGELADTSSGAEFRAAIDAALAAHGGKE